MLAPLATLVFLATLWLVAKLIVETIDESGGRVVAALLGRPHRVETEIPPMRVRVSRARPARSMPAKQQWRAAA